MVETICRTTREQEMASTAGYNEGYFNEIIQNANDLNCGTIIEITVSKNKNIYSLSCKYRDDGFSISNIYGFLNREMSDKSAEIGQSGKFGVGIKSLFSFVKRLTVTSNVVFDFSIEHKNDEFNINGDVILNGGWDKENTVLAFEYDKNAETSFNIQKLTKFVDFLHGDDDGEVSEFFWSDDIDNMVFDIRSLVFMNISNNNSKISQMTFRGDFNEVFLKLISGDLYTKDKSAIKKITLQLEDNTDLFEQDFLFINTQSVSIAYPLSEDDEMNRYNRHYSTYFIRTDTKQRILPTSALIHSSKYVNMHRTDFGNNESDIENNFKKLAEDIKEIFKFICSKECGNSPLAVATSDILHKLLYRYLEQDIDTYPESPFSIEGLTTEYLPKTQDGVCKRFVVNKEKNPGYTRIAEIDAKDMCLTLEQLYIKIFERGETVDFSRLSSSANVITGVKTVYDKLASLHPNEYSVRLWRLLGYFANTAYLICYRISGQFAFEAKISDNQIDEWLLQCNEKEIPYLLKLFGRSAINHAIAFDGSIISKNLSFHGYLFNNYLPEGKGILAVEQNKYFDKKYSALKSELLAKRFIDEGNTQNYYVRCIKAKYESARKWDGAFDYYNDVADVYYNYSGQLNNVLLFLERVANDADIINNIYFSFYDQLSLFEKEVRSFWYRENLFKYYDVIQQQIVNIDCLKKIVLNGLKDYFNAVDFINEIKSHINYLHYSHCLQHIFAKCVISSITTEEIRKDFIPELCERYSNQKAAFNTKNIRFNAITPATENGCGSQMQDFLFRKTGHKFYVYDTDFGLNRKKSVCYFANANVKYRSSATDSSFDLVASVGNIENNVYIFCANFGGDVNGVKDVISLVMHDIGIKEDVINLFDGYMPNRKSTNTLNYTAYASLVMHGKRHSLLTSRKKLSLDFAQVKGDGLFSNFNNSFLIKLLSARGSYDVYCPICADIPIEAFLAENKRRPSRNLIVLENSNVDTKNEFPFVVMIACERCKQKLSATLHNSNFNGKSVTLTFDIAHGQHEKVTYKQTIELSPVNVAIMKGAIN